MLAFHCLLSTRGITSSLLLPSTDSMRHLHMGALNKIKQSADLRLVYLHGGAETDTLQLV